MSSNSFIVVSASTRSFSCREIVCTDITDAAQTLAAEVADGWIAWISTIEIEVDTDETRAAWRAAKRAAAETVRLADIAAYDERLAAEAAQIADYHARRAASFRRSLNALG